MTKKIFAAAIIIISLLAFALLVALSSMDYDLLVQNYLKDSGVTTDASHANQITLRKLPIPYLTIDSIKKDGQIELNDIEVHFSWASLITLAPKIESVKIAEAKIYSANNNLTIINHDRFVQDLIAKNKSNINIYIRTLYYSTINNSIIARINNFSLTQKEGESNNNIAQGDIANLGNFTGFFTKNADNTTTFNLNITNGNSEMQLTEIYKDSGLDSGKVALKITKLSSFLRQYCPELSRVFKNIKSKEVVDIRFDILPMQDLMQFQNLIIESSLVKGNGKIDISKSNPNSNLLTLNFSQIDIESMIGDGNSNKASKNDKADQPKSTLSFARTKKDGNFIATDISINKVILSKTESLDDVRFVSNFENGIFVIKNLSGSIRSGGKFKISGNIADNNFRNIFDGNIYLEHKNFNEILGIFNGKDMAVTAITPFILSSDLKLTLIDLCFNNLLFKTDEVKVSGNVSTKFIGSTPRVNVNLDFSSMDLGKVEYPIISPAIGFTKNLFHNMKDKEYLNKFIPIRTLPYIGHWNLTFTDLTYNDKYIGHLNILAILSPGNVKIDNFDINNGSNFLFSSLNLEANGIKPKLDIVIENGLLNVDFLTPSSWVALRHKLYNDFSLDKVTLTFNCFISTIYQNNTKIDNLKFYANNDNILLKISDLNADIFKGNLQGSGSILLEPHTINFVYALNSIDITELLGILPPNLFYNKGSASINGMFSTNGDTIEKLLYNLYTKSSIIAKNLTVPNFGIDDFIEKITLPKYDIQEIKSDLNNAITTGTTEIETLKSDIELNRGKAISNNLLFKTKYASGSAGIAFNLYDFNMNLSSIFLFYSAADVKNRPENIVKIGVKAAGLIFEPQKTVDMKELMEFFTKNTANKN